MVRRLLGNPAALFGITKFEADLRYQGIPAGRETLYEIPYHLEDAFLLHFLRVATDSEKRKQVNPRKVYPSNTARARPSIAVRRPIPVMPSRSRFTRNCYVAARKWPTLRPRADTRLIFSTVVQMAERPSSRCAPSPAMPRSLSVRFRRPAPAPDRGIELEPSAASRSNRGVSGVATDAVGGERLREEESRSGDRRSETKSIVGGAVRPRASLLPVKRGKPLGLCFEVCPKLRR